VRAVVVDSSRMKTETVDFSAQLRDWDGIAAQWVRLSSEHKTSSCGNLYTRGVRKLRGEPYVDLLEMEIYDFDKRVEIKVFGRTTGSVYSVPWAELPVSAEYVYK
jgi:hypothetical protein